MKSVSAIFDLETLLTSCRHDLVTAKATFDDFQAYVREERAELLLLMAQAASPLSYEALRKRVHRLKSSAGFVGANGVSQTAMALQTQLVADEPPVSVGEALRALNDSLEAFLSIPSFENAFKLIQQERSDVRGHKAAENDAAVQLPQASS